MNSLAIAATLSGFVPLELAEDLVEEFVEICRDVSIGALGGSSPGKFVETVVQVLQFLETGKYEEEPKVDEYLRNLDSRPVVLDVGLRICASRVARAMYTLRNKRDISHKGLIDVNRYDLEFLHSAAQWILTEIVRLARGISIEEAGKIVSQIQAPVGALVEDFGDRRLVLEALSTGEEVLVLLRSYYPEIIPVSKIAFSLDRRKEKTVQNTLYSLWQERMIEGNSDSGYKLTLKGLGEAVGIANRCLGLVDA